VLIVVAPQSSATGWTPKTLFDVGDSILCPVTYYVSRIYKERINAFPTERGTNKCVPYRKRLFFDFSEGAP